VYIESVAVVVAGVLGGFVEGVLDPAGRI
jgi:hypothetical protein